MYNSDVPSRAELPSSKQLLRSTVIAAASAAVLLFTVILPSEYGIDPTGVGRVLRLTEMGEIKTQLAAEAASDAAADAEKAKLNSSKMAVREAQAGQVAERTVSSPSVKAMAEPSTAPVAASETGWRDQTRFTLAPGQGIEIKLRMKEGAKADFAWAVKGSGAVNFDTHGDGGGRSVSYEKGRGVSSNDGTLVAAFTGNHGWFWRNRGSSEVAVVLQTKGDYLEILRPRM